MSHLHTNEIYLLYFQSVFPLNETNGIIEWIDNLMPMRGIIVKLVKEKYGIPGSQEVKDLQTVPGDVVGNKKKYDTLLKHYPPVFADWFVRNFPGKSKIHCPKISPIQHSLLPISGFVLDEKFQRNASKFLLIYVYKNQFLCRHRAGGKM